MVATVVEMVRRFLASRGRDGDAETVHAPVATAGSNDQEQAQEDELAGHLKERQTLLGHAKLAAVVLLVLLVLNIEATPFVVADFHLQDQYGDQVRSLVEVEGHVARFDEIVSGGAPLWEERVSDQIDTAMRRIDELDAFFQAYAAYDQSPARGKEPAPDPPKFVQDCSDRDPAVTDWIRRSAALRINWQRVVERCIIEKMGPDFDNDGQDRLSAPVVAANTDVTTAIALARREFPQAAGTVTPVPCAPSVTPTAEPSVTPTAEPVEQIAHCAFNDIERKGRYLEGIIRAGPEGAINPPPTAWLAMFTGPDGSLRSFRDNILLTYASPYGGASSRDDPNAQLSISPLEVSVAGDPGLKLALNDVRASQAALHDQIDARTAALEPAIPDLFKPVLIFAKPTYLVLFFPLAVTLIGGYLLTMFTRLQWNARRLRAAGADEPQPQPLLFFGALLLVPLALLVGLFPAYDWPQFAYNWWQWSHRGPLALFIVIALGCAFFVYVAARADASNDRPLSEPEAPPVSAQPEPAPETEST